MLSVFERFRFANTNWKAVGPCGMYDVTTNAFLLLLFFIKLLGNILPAWHVPAISTNRSDVWVERRKVIIYWLLEKKKVIRDFGFACMGFTCRDKGTFCIVHECPHSNGIAHCCQMPLASTPQTALNVEWKGKSSESVMKQKHVALIQIIPSVNLPVCSFTVCVIVSLSSRPSHPVTPIPCCFPFIHTSPASFDQLRVFNWKLKPQDFMYVCSCFNVPVLFYELGSVLVYR